MQSLMPDQVFISYAHEDRAALDEFLTHLRPLEERGLLRAWSDEEIPPGSSWNDQIKSALGSARIGLLLVSDSFLGSKYITREELATLLARRNSGDASLYWVKIAPCADVPELESIQALSDPSRPLNTLKKPRRQAEIVKICKTLLDRMGQLPALSRRDRVNLRQSVGSVLANKYRVLEEIGTGAATICYKAEQDLPLEATRTVVVKTFVSSDAKCDIDADLAERLRIASRLTDPAFIRLIEASSDVSLRYVVTEYVDGTTFDRYLETNQCVPAQRVRAILLRLARALREAHRNGYLHEGLLPSNVHIDREHRPRVSPFRLAAQGPNLGCWGNFLINHEVCTYLTPEQFDGGARTPLTDQYSLGLLGYELLVGRPIASVTRPADFVDRRALYKTIASGDELLRRPAVLCGIVSRMLRVKPEDRWATMDEVVDGLESIDVADSLEEARRRVLASYMRFQAPAKALAFSKGLYQHFFAAAPGVERLFRKDRDAQYEALNRAMKALVDHRSDSPESVRAIERIAVGHAGYGITKAQIAAFMDAVAVGLSCAGERDPETHDAWHDVLVAALRTFARALGLGDPEPVPRMNAEESRECPPGNRAKAEAALSVHDASLG